MGNKKMYSISGFPEKLNQLIYIDNDSNCVQLSNAIGADRKTIYMWLHGYSAPNAVYLKRICTFFHVSADWLLGLDVKDLY